MRTFIGPVLYFIGTGFLVAGAWGTWNGLFEADSPVGLSWYIGIIVIGVGYAIWKLEDKRDLDREKRNKSFKRDNTQKK